MIEKKAKIIEFKAPDGEAMVKIKPSPYGQCEHPAFSVDEKSRAVECRACNRELDAMHVLILIAHSERRRRWIVENREAYARKAAAKTIKAAVISLRKRGINPDRFAALYEKYLKVDDEEESRT